MDQKDLGPKRRAERLGLTSHVRFVGYVPEEEAAEFYSQSTVRCCFRRITTEGFPMAILQRLGTWSTGSDDTYSRCC